MRRLLFDSPEPTADYLVAPRRLAFLYTSRADLADALVRAATNDEHSQEFIGIATRSGAPKFVSAFLDQAFGIRL